MIGMLVWVWAAFWVGQHDGEILKVTPNSLVVRVYANPDDFSWPTLWVDLEIFDVFEGSRPDKIIPSELGWCVIPPQETLPEEYR